MKRLGLVLLVIAVLGVGVVAAQTDCGDGLPCGRLPWPLPALPSLPSPTPMPTIQITFIPTSAATPTSAPTSAPPPTTISQDFTDLSDQLGTLSAVVGATDVPILVSGTPVDPNEAYDQLNTDAGTFFGYLKGVQGISLGGFTPFIGIAILFLLISIAGKAVSFILPVVAVILRLIMRIAEVIKKLIAV